METERKILEISISRVPDPTFLIVDPDPQNEDQGSRIRILL